MVEKKEEQVTEVSLTEIVTGTDTAFKLPTGEVVDLKGYLVWLGNEILHINKALR